MSKIIIVDNSLDITGAFKSAFRNVSKSNHNPEFFYFIPTGSRVAELLRIRGVTTYTFRSFELSRQVRNIILYLPFLFWNGYRLAQIIKKHGIDTVYQNEVFILTGLVARLFVKIAIVTHIRVMPTVFPVILFRMWLCLQDLFSTRLLATSFVCAAAAQNIYPVKKAIEVVYDFDLPDTVLPPYVVQTCCERGSLLFVGNYTKGKGHDLALQIAYLLTQRHPAYDLSLLMVGSDFGYPANLAYRRFLEAYIRHRGMGSVVHLGDFSTNIEELMKSHDVLLNLSTAESFSWVVAEALWFGIPVVATDSGGPGELIEQDVSGLLVSPDPSLVADYVWDLLQNPHRRRDMSNQGKARISRLIEAHGSKSFNSLFVSRSYF